MNLFPQTRQRIGMSLERVPVRSRRYWVVYWGLAFALAALVMVFFLRGLHWDEPRLTLEQLMNGTAHKPFVYRVLITSLARITENVFPIEPRLTVSALLFLSLLGFVPAVRYFQSGFWKSTVVSDLMALLALVAVIPLTLYNRKPYVPFLYLYYLFCMAYCLVGIAGVVHQFDSKPVFLRRAALMVTPLLVLVFLLFAVPFELRDFYEVFPVLYLLAAPSLLTLIYVKLEPLSYSYDDKDIAWRWDDPKVTVDQ